VVNDSQNQVVADAERAVLGAILLDNTALDIISEYIQPETFYTNDHYRLIYAAIQELRGKKPIDLLTVIDRLIEKKQFQTKENPAGVITPVEISNLAGQIGTASNIEFWADIMLKNQMRRRVIQEAQIAIHEAQTSEDIEATISTVSMRMQRLLEGLPTLDINIETIANNAVAEIRSLVSGTITPGIKTGLHILDGELRGGFKPSHLVCLAGRPGTGKSALAFQIALHASGIGKYIAVFSLEMTANELIQRAICQLGEINSANFRPQGLSESELYRVSDAGYQISGRSLCVYDAPNMTVAKIASKVRRLHKDKRIDMAIIDYLQLIPAEWVKGQTRERQVAEMSRALKNLARELNITVMMLSQFNRDVEDRKLGRPRLSDLRESGAIEADCDVVLGISRPSTYVDGYEPQYTLLDLMKNRNGKSNLTFELQFQEQFVRFIKWTGIKGGKSGLQPTAPIKDYKNYT